MRVIVTGSRAWPSEAEVFGALNDVLMEHGPFILIHGACSTGADFFASRWAKAHPEVAEERFPADWAAYGRRAGPIRNERIVRAGADLVLAFPLPEGKGTQHTIRLAREAGIPVQVWGLRE
jgi:hypothetical protein